MHASVMRFVVENLYPHEVKGRKVLEVGSADVNGSVRPLVMSMAPASYLGIDLAEGPGVDHVLDISSISGEQKYQLRSEVVISTEMLEHAQDWQQALIMMASVCTETLILTCRGTDSRGTFHRHNEPDYWRFRPSDLVRACAAVGLIVVRCEQDPQVPGVFLKAVRPMMIDAERAP